MHLCYLCVTEPWLGMSSQNCCAFAAFNTMLGLPQGFKSVDVAVLWPKGYTQFHGWHFTVMLTSLPRVPPDPGAEGSHSMPAVPESEWSL